MSCDGTWQRRSHQSLYGMQAAISVDTRKVLDYEIQSKICTECQLHGNWDHRSEAYKKWYEQHQPTCHINYWSTYNSIEAFGSKMWRRSLKKRNLISTTYMGDGNSAAHKAIVEANTYGDEHTVIKSDCIGHVQKRMGTSLERLLVKCKDQIIILTTEGSTERKGIIGRSGLTKEVIDKVHYSFPNIFQFFPLFVVVVCIVQIQNYYSMAIRGHLGNMDGTTNALHAILGHSSNDHPYCPDDETNWCKIQRNDPSYKPKEIAPEALELCKPDFERLSHPDLLARVQRGDTQNPNEALHNIVWRRAPKHMFTSPQAIRIATDLGVIQRNVGNVGLLRVLKAMNITNNTASSNLFKKLDALKFSSLTKKKSEATRKRRQIIRGQRKKKQDRHEQTEKPSYETGVFCYLPVLVI